MSEEVATAAADRAWTERLTAENAELRTIAERLGEELRTADAEIAAAKELIDGMRRTIAESAAREAGLSLAADQYSESRDQWMLKAKAAEADAAALVAEYKRIRAMREAGLYGSARLEESALLEKEHPGAKLLTEYHHLLTLAPVATAAARLAETIRPSTSSGQAGDGTGKCWCAAHEADALRRELEKAGLV